MPAWGGRGRGQNEQKSALILRPENERCSYPLVPAEWDMSRTVTAFLHQGLVEFPASTRMNSSPAIFTVILQTGDISTEKRSKLSTTAGPLTFITQLIIQDIWLNFHLQPKVKRKVFTVFSEWSRHRLLWHVHFHPLSEWICVPEQGSIPPLLKWRQSIV